MKTTAKNIMSALLKPRVAESHKGNYGHALIVAGNIGKMGAAVIASKACLRTGVGLLTVNVPEEERFILQTAIPEAMLMMRENKNNKLTGCKCVGIGPGISTDKDAKKILEKILDETNLPMVIDADALNILAENKKLFSHIPKGSVITPHQKEFDRLFGHHELIEDRIKTAIKVANEFEIVVVIKGHNTFVTFGGEQYINTTGNAGLAKGGSGDALTGMITALLAQGYDSFDAARLGIYLHGLAADIALDKQSMESMLITDVIECIGKAFKTLG